MSASDTQNQGASQSITGPPDGSTIEMKRSGDLLTIVLPRARAEFLSVFPFVFSIIWFGACTFFTVTILTPWALMGAVMGLFLIPFWLVGFGLFWFGLRGLWAKTHITMDKDVFGVRHLLGTFQLKRVEVRLDSIASIEMKKVNLDSDGNQGPSGLMGTLEALTSQALHKAVPTLTLDSNTHYFGGGLSEAEMAWLVETIQIHRLSPSVLA